MDMCNVLSLSLSLNSVYCVHGYFTVPCSINSMCSSMCMLQSMASRFAPSKKDWTNEIRCRSHFISFQLLHSALVVCIHVSQRMDCLTPHQTPLHTFSFHAAHIKRASHKLIWNAIKYKWHIWLQQKTQGSPLPRNLIDSVWCAPCRCCNVVLDF